MDARADLCANALRYVPKLISKPGEEEEEEEEEEKVDLERNDLIKAGKRKRKPLPRPFDAINFFKARMLLRKHRGIKIKIIIRLASIISFGWIIFNEISFTCTRYFIISFFF